MIRRRVTPYAFALLVAVVLSLLPPAIFADLLIPYESWENWSRRGPSEQRPRFTAANPPPVLRAEVAIFKLLAGPPGWVRERVTGSPTVYAAQFAPRGIIYETGGVPPFAFAVSHLAWAIPLWFIVAATLYESLRLIRSRRTSRRG